LIHFYKSFEIRLLRNNIISMGDAEDRARLLDSTQYLLDAPIPAPIIDSSDDEVTFDLNPGPKREVAKKKLKRRDTVSLSDSVTEWRKTYVKSASRDSLLSISSSSSGAGGRRSSLLSQENSITEESDDALDEDAHDTEEDLDQHCPPEVHNSVSEDVRGEPQEELEIISNNQDKALDWSASEANNESVADVSGVAPLEKTRDSTEESEEDEGEDERRRSVSGIYDSFSEDTAEETMDTGDESQSAEEEDPALDHVRRKILQDTLVSNTSQHGDDVEMEEEELQLPTVVVSSEPSPQVQVTAEADYRDEDAEEIPSSPSVYYTAPSSRRQTASETSLGGAVSPSFDTTAEEMALYAMYGEDYDEIVAKMSHEEKLALAAELNNKSEEETAQLKEKLMEVLNKHPRLSSVSSLGSPRSSLFPQSRPSIGSDVSPFSLASTATATPSPNLLPVFHDGEHSAQLSPTNIPPPAVKIITATPENQGSVPQLHEEERSASEIDDVSKSEAGPGHVAKLSPGSRKYAPGDGGEDTEAPIFSFPNNVSFDVDDKEEVGGDGEATENSVTAAEAATEDARLAAPIFTNHFMLPTASSLTKMAPQSPSPRKAVQQTPVWMPPSPSPSKAVCHNANLKSPHGSLKRPAPVSRLPQPIRTPLSQGRPDLGNLRTPTSNKKAAAIKTAYAAVASPVAAYVKNNPAPPLVRNVEAKSPTAVLDSTLVHVEEKENAGRLSLLPPCPLPSAVYKAAAAMDEEEDGREEAQDYEYVTEAYGAASLSAKVTKHVARVKMPNSGLSWDDDSLVNTESVNSSPSVAKFKQPAKSVLKMTRRDSGLFDESMMNVSVVETKVVKKVARGKKANVSVLTGKPIKGKKK